MLTGLHGSNCNMVIAWSMISFNYDIPDNSVCAILQYACFGAFGDTKYKLIACWYQIKPEKK